MTGICPNCDIKMTNDTQKIEFEDMDGNCRLIEVTAEWCVDCGYEGMKW